jgi:hypothetical protein
MLSTLGIDNKLKTALELRGMPTEAFAQLAGLENIRYASKSKLFEAFRGVKALSNETALALWELWCEVERLCSDVTPLTLNLSDGGRVHEWIVARRKEELHVNIRGRRDYDSDFMAGMMSGLRGE